jgi:hypothetical protein
VKFLVVIAAAVSLTGCRFWYKPVPVANAIGEQKALLAGTTDSLNVYRETRFEIYGPNVESVYDGYEQLNRAYRAFEHYFGEPAPKLAIVANKDTAQALVAASRALQARGFSLVRYIRPRNVQRRYNGLNYGGTLWPLAPVAARALLGHYAIGKLPDGTATVDAALDRYPLWFRAAVIHLVGEAGSATNDLDYVRDKRGELRPITELVALVRPSNQDALLDPSRRGEADEFTRVAAAESAMLARYLVEREGAGILERLSDGFLAGRTFASMSAQFTSAPKDIVELDRVFRIWIETLEN